MDEFVFEPSSNHLESLICSRQHIKKSALLDKLDVLINLELDLAIMGAEKAKNELLKNSAKVRSIK